MVDISSLLFKREHFPVILETVTTTDGRQSRDIRAGNLPPYHPSMRKEGIDLLLAVSVLGEALKYTILDLEEIAGHMPNYRTYFLERITRDANGRIVYGSPVTKGAKIEITDFPFLPGGYLCISREYITPGASTGEISITGDMGAVIRVPETVIFPEELMKEYRIRQVQSVGTRFKEFESPYGWFRHNLYSDIQKIFSKNFIIAIDNGVVRRKYQEKT